MVPPDLLAELAQLRVEVDLVPAWLLKRIREDGIDPDTVSISYSNEGRRYVIANYGELRAMGRVVERVERLLQNPIIGLPEGAVLIDPGCPQPRTCTGCGCTNLRPCEGGCHWIELTLCSRCGPKEIPA